MDLMAYIFSGGDLRASTPGPFDDHWYGPVPGVMTEAGMRVDEHGAQMLSAWYRGRLILASTLAMLPLQVYRRLPDDGGAKPDPQHPLYDVLHDQPNDYQSTFDWRLEQMFDIIDHGWAYDWIIEGRRGFVDQLIPIAPTLVTPKATFTKLPNGATVQGRWLFDVRDPKVGNSKTFTQDEIFYLRGAGGKGILEYARTSLGTALATESYAANIFSRGTLNGGVIENPGVLDKEAGQRMAESFITAARNWHLPKILEQGSKFVANEMTPEDAQMLLSRKHSVDDISRWLGVPRLMLENSDPSFGNAEQFTQNFLDINMGGWLALWEFGLNRQVILAPQKYFCQFKRQAFVRANFKDRVEGHVALVNAGIETVDEARSVEDMGKRGGKADELREPQNITGKPKVAGAAPAKPDTKAEAIATASASRLLRKEVTAIQKLAVKHASDGGFDAAVSAFYAKHGELVTETLQMPRADADAYCVGQVKQILEGDWLNALDLWKTEAYAAGLAGIALEGEAAA